MELVLALLALVGVAGFGAGVARAFGNVPELIGLAFVPMPELGWPVGVQEDDDFRWNWRAPGAEESWRGGSGHAIELAPVDAQPREAAIEELPAELGPRPEPVRAGVRRAG